VGQERGFADLEGRHEDEGSQHDDGHRQDDRPAVDKAHHEPVDAANAQGRRDAL